MLIGLAHWSPDKNPVAPCLVNVVKMALQEVVTMVRIVHFDELLRRPREMPKPSLKQFHEMVKGMAFEIVHLMPAGQIVNE